MSAGKAIYGILSANAGVTALVSTRIYPDIATQDTAFPFVVYQIEGTAPSDTKDGVSKLDMVDFAVMAYAKTYTNAQDIASACRTALDRYSGTVNGISVDSIIFKDQQSGQMNADEHVFAVMQAYSLRQKR